MRFDNPDHPDHVRYINIVDRILWIPALIVFQFFIGEMISRFFLVSFQFYVASPFLFYWWVFVSDILFLLVLKWKVYKGWVRFLMELVKFWHSGIINILRGQ